MYPRPAHAVLVLQAPHPADGLAHRPSPDTLKPALLCLFLIDSLSSVFTPFPFSFTLHFQPLVPLLWPGFCLLPLTHSWSHACCGPAASCPQAQRRGPVMWDSLRQILMTGVPAGFAQVMKELCPVVETAAPVCGP